MKDLTELGKSTGFDSSGNPTILDWKSFLMEKIIPTFHYQPLVARKILTPTPIEWDGHKIAEIPLYNDIEDPAYGMEPVHKDTKIEGDVATVPLPQISLTTLLSQDEINRPFAQRDRLSRWMNQAVKKIAQFEDIKAFRGDTNLGVNGFISSDSHDLGAPTGKWDVDTGSNGILNNAWDDMIKAKDYFIHEGLGERPLKIVLTSYAYTLLKSTIVLYTNQTNYDLWLQALPPGSEILYSNNIQDGVDENTNTMVAFCQLLGDDEGGYQLFSTGLDQQIHRTDVWEYRYGLREKFSVKVADDAFIAWMDAIDTTT